jgi:hypothetical protein
MELDLGEVGLWIGFVLVEWEGRKNAEQASLARVFWKMNEWTRALHVGACRLLLFLCFYSSRGLRLFRLDQYTLTFLHVVKVRVYFGTE